MLKSAFYFPACKGIPFPKRDSIGYTKNPCNPVYVLKTRAKSLCLQFKAIACPYSTYLVGEYNAAFLQRNLAVIFNATLVTRLIGFIYNTHEIPYFSAN